MNIGRENERLRVEPVNDPFEEALEASRTHVCFATRCGEIIPRHHLMCPEHWFGVPYVIRVRVNREYRRGFSKAWLEAVTDARRSIEELERAGG